MADERKGYFATGKMAVPGPDESATMVEAARHPQETDAKLAAVHLLEAGIGAEVQVAADDPTDDPADEGTTGNSGPTGSGAWQVMVLRSDLDRATVILAEPHGNVSPGGKSADWSGANASGGDGRDAASDVGVEKEKIPWGRVLLIFLVALIVLPGAAFWLTMRALGGDCPSGPDVPVSVILNTTC